jgi:glycosyltransferase involved in cell wall biosynthesis
MHLLFIVPYVPTPIRVRPYNLVKFLARRGHTITLATLWESVEERDRLDELKAWGVKIVTEPLSRSQKLLNLARALPTQQSLQSWFCWQPKLARRIEAQLAQYKFDALHVEHLRGSRYAFLAKDLIAKSQIRTPVVWDSVDSITYLFEQASRQSQSASKKLMTMVELGRTRKQESWLVSQFDHVLVTSRLDKEALLKLAKRNAAPITVLSNGVDLDVFSQSDIPREINTLVFSGKMSYHANITAATHLVKKIMPRVWTERPDTKVWIVGKDPAQEVKQLALDFPDKVVVTGSVPNLAEYLQRASVAVVPIVYGAGVQNKALEAMACATPVVSSHRAVAALSVTSGETLLVAEDDETFAQHTLRLLNDSDLRARLSSAGRAFVETHHSWDAIAARLEEIYRTPPRSNHTRP